MNMRILVKAEKNAIKVGHKYLWRKPKAGGGFDYGYHLAHVRADNAAHQAAASPHNARALPTDAQKEAGNFKTGQFSWNGLTVAIENPAGSLRQGTDSSGNTWSIRMPYHYGYVRNTKGADGEKVDVFIGSNLAAPLVYVVDQVKPDGSFDESKVMIGFNSQESATRGYKGSYSAGWRGLGGITAMTIAVFKRWLKRGAGIKQALSSNRRLQEQLTAEERRSRLKDRIASSKQTILQRIGIDGPVLAPVPAAGIEPDPPIMHAERVSPLMDGDLGGIAQLMIPLITDPPRPFPADAAPGSVVIGVDRVKGGRITCQLADLPDPDGSVQLILNEAKQSWNLPAVQPNPEDRMFTWNPNTGVRLDWYTEAEYQSMYPDPLVGAPLSNEALALDLSDGSRTGGKGTEGDIRRALAYLQDRFLTVTGKSAKADPDPRSLIQAARSFAVLEQVLGGVDLFKHINLRVGRVMGIRTNGEYVAGRGSGSLELDDKFQHTVWHEVIHGTDHMLGGLGKTLASENPDHPLSRVAELIKLAPSTQAMMSKPRFAEKADYYLMAPELIARFGAEWISYRLRVKGYTGAIDRPHAVAEHPFTEEEMRVISPYFEAALASSGLVIKSLVLGVRRGRR